MTPDVPSSTTQGTSLVCSFRVSYLTLCSHLTLCFCQDTCAFWFSRRTRADMYRHTQLLAHIHERMLHTYIYTYMHAYKHTYMHTYIHAYMHTNIHTHMCAAWMLTDTTNKQTNKHTYSRTHRHTRTTQTYTRKDTHTCV